MPVERGHGVDERIRILDELACRDGVLQVRAWMDGFL